MTKDESLGDLIRSVGSNWLEENIKRLKIEMENNGQEWSGWKRTEEYERTIYQCGKLSVELENSKKEDQVDPQSLATCLCCSLGFCL